MKSIILKSLLVAIATFVSLGTQSAHAQTGGVVAVLDVAKVFKDNQAFTTKMNTIRANAEKLKQQIVSRQEAIKVEAQGLAALTIGSPERDALESQLETKQAQLRRDARRQETALLNQEATVYYDTYRNMQEVVKSLAAANGISLVLRYDSSEIDRENRPDVIKGVNRTVVYENVDLTKLVTDAMGPRTADAQAQKTTQYK